MHFRTRVRRAFENLSGVKMYRVTPRGVDVARDIRRSFPDFRIEKVFDVGANLGQSADIYLADFPDARIWSFEPSRSTFERLQDRFKTEQRVTCVNSAFSDRSGTADMELAKKSHLRRLIADGADGEELDAPKETVILTTVDSFCAKEGIDRIDYMKIDTEGHESQVLEGARHMLENNAIAMIELELGMNPDNRRHTRFEDAKAVLEHKGYRVFSIREQIAEFPTKQQHLRRVNAVFVSLALSSSQAKSVVSR